MALAGTVYHLRGVAWVFVLVPALYLGADLAEDTLLASFLVTPTSITSAAVTATQVLTKIKIWTVVIAGAQVVVLGFAAMIWHQ